MRREVTSSCGLNKTTWTLRSRGMAVGARCTLSLSRRSDVDIYWLAAPGSRGDEQGHGSGGQVQVGLHLGHWVGRQGV